jgi:hypothetical protein
MPVDLTVAAVDPDRRVLLRALRAHAIEVLGDPRTQPRDVSPLLAKIAAFSAEITGLDQQNAVEDADDDAARAERRRRYETEEEEEDD